MQRIYTDVVQTPTGDVLSGASVFIYTTGTFSAATVYSDNGITTVPQPLTTDGNGQFTAYAANGRYDIRVIKAGYADTWYRDVLLEDPTQGNNAGQDSSGALVTASGTSFARSLAAWGGDRINIKSFGAVGDGITNDRTAIQSFLTYITTNNTAGYVPTGRYFVPNSSDGGVTFTGNLRLMGDGMLNSVFVYNDDADTTRRDFFTSSSATNVDIEGIGFESSWGNDGTYTQRSQLFAINSLSGSARIHRCRFSKSRFMSMIITGGERATVTECEFYRGVADGCRLIGIKRNIVIGNTFEDINDDSIAIHTQDATASPIDKTAIVCGNTITNGQGICILGAKKLDVIGNTLNRVQVRAIAVGVPGGTEGDTATIGINIQGNNITDVFKGSTFSGSSGGTVQWIIVYGIAPTTGGGGYVGGSNGAGGVVQPYAYLYTNDIDVGTNPGGWWINISNNICARTLTSGAAYSAWGFGTRYGRSGPVDPTIAATDLQGDQIVVQEHGRNVIIANNVCEGAGNYGIYADGTAASAYVSFRNFKIDGNIVSNCLTATIRIDGVGHVDITNNTLDGDPYHVNNHRAANGKWAATYANMVAISTNSTATGTIAHNIIRNVGGVFGGADETVFTWFDNILACDPVAVGYDANNIGIGNPGRPTFYGTALIEDGDPASATFGKVKNTCLLASSSIPTVGKYVRDHFVKKLAPAVAGGAGSQYVIVGWVRQTTGSAHVLNTDWSEMRTLTGT